MLSKPEFSSASVASHSRNIAFSVERRRRAASRAFAITVSSALERFLERFKQFYSHIII